MRPRRAAATPITFLLGLFVLMAAAVPEAVHGQPLLSAKSKDGNTLDESVDPVFVSSDEGSFQAMFPRGCARMKHRFNEPDPWADVPPDKIVSVVRASCDRYDKQGEGCSVTALLDFPGEDGNPVGPTEVLDMVQNILGNFGAQVVRQSPTRKDLGPEGKIEGIDVLARADDGIGEVWVRGLLYFSDVYILVAWNDMGSLWDDDDYRTFFASFLPFPVKP